MCGRWPRWLLGALSACVVAAPAAASVPLFAPLPDGPLYTVAGGLLPGPLGGDGFATDHNFSSSIDWWPRAVAGLPDGGFIFGTPTRVLRVSRSGRIGPLPELAGFEVDVSGLAVTPRGDIVVADSTVGEVSIVHPDGRAPTFGGIGAAGIGATRDNGVLVADAEGNRVRLIDADGRVTVVAGTGKPGHGGDGGPATAAQLQAPSAVAALPDGGFLIGDGGNSPDNANDCTSARLRRVAPDGAITTLARIPAIALLATADGGFVASRPPDCVNPTWPNRLVAGDAQGHLRALDQGSFGFGELNGLPIARARARAYGLGWSSDGGILIADWRTRIRYWAPAQSRRLAVAITPMTLRTGRHLRVHYRLTMAAAITATVRDGRRVIRSVSRHGVAGMNVLTFRRPVALGSYDIRVVARATNPGRAASDAVRVRPSGYLTVGAALQALDITQAQQVPGAGKEDVGRCRRFGPRRIDCGMVGDGLCQVVYAVFLHRDGTVWTRFYGDADLPPADDPSRCIIRRHPHWSDWADSVLP